MKKMKFVFDVISCFFVLLSVISCNFSAGSYPYAEVYELKNTQEELIRAVNLLKKNNPELIVPKVTINNKGEWDLKDGRKDDSRWHCFYFYLPQTDEIVLTGVRPNESNGVKFYLISMNKGLNIGSWKRINKDFEKRENKSNILKFEETILRKIELYLNK